MTRQVYKEYNQGEILLFPPSIESMVPQDSPARLVDYVIKQLDIHELLDTYKGGDTSSYHPRMLLKVIFFAYMNNVYSCRKIARQLRENVLYIWFAGGQQPDFRTINNFRSHRLKDTINKLFTQVVLTEEGLRHRSRRPIEPEAVFGQMKFNMGYKRFRHVGEKLCNMDFGIFAIAFNLLKLSRLKGFKWDYFLRRMQFIASICRYLVKENQKKTKVVEFKMMEHRWKVENAA